MKIKVTVSGQEHKLEYDEAMRLFMELNKVFGYTTLQAIPAPYHGPAYPYPQTVPCSPIPDLPHVTCGMSMFPQKS